MGTCPWLGCQEFVSSPSRQVCRAVAPRSGGADRGGGGGGGGGKGGGGGGGGFIHIQ